MTVYKTIFLIRSYDIEISLEIGANNIEDVLRTLKIRYGDDFDQIIDIKELNYF